MDDKQNRKTVSEVISIYRQLEPILNGKSIPSEDRDATIGVLKYLLKGFSFYKVNQLKKIDYSEEEYKSIRKVKYLAFLRNKLISERMMILLDKDVAFSIIQREVRILIQVGAEIERICDFFPFDEPCEIDIDSFAKNNDCFEALLAIKEFHFYRKDHSFSKEMVEKYYKTVIGSGLIPYYTDDLIKHFDTSDDLETIEMNLYLEVSEIKRQIHETNTFNFNAMYGAESTDNTDYEGSYMRAIRHGSGDNIGY